MKKPIRITAVLLLVALLVPVCFSFTALALPTKGEFRVGARGAEVTEIQSRLNSLGYMESKHITGYFGTITEAAVKKFQQDNGIDAIGICGPQTLKALAGQDSELKLGARGDRVKEVQQRLNTLGYMKKAHVTGYFGTITKAAVAKFQKDFGISAIGVCGPQTLTALFSNPVNELSTTKTIRPESRGDDVKTLQQALIMKGFLGSSYATGYYGSLTTAAVKTFQKANGLTQDGIAGSKTLTKLKSSSSASASNSGTSNSGQNSGSSKNNTTSAYYAKPGTLRYGDRGPLVTDLQNTLAKKGFYSGSATGIFDSKTKTAVVSFQKANGLSTDGVVGGKTNTRLKATSSTSNTTTNTGSGNQTVKYTSPDKAKLDALYKSYSAAQKEDITLLARLIYAESRGETYEGQVAVGSVVMNRVASTKSTIYQVIHAKNQFSVVNSSSFNRTPTQACTYAAIDAYNGAKPVGKSLYFNMSHLNNTWAARNRTLSKVIGTHAFYL